MQHLPATFLVFKYDHRDVLNKYTLEKHMKT